MRRVWLACVLALAAAEVRAAAPVQWVWSADGDGSTGTRYFRKAFALARPADEADLDVTADDAFTVWVNGVEVGRGSDWTRVKRFDITKHLAVGANVIAVEARNAAGPAGLLVRAGYAPNGQSRVALATDATWRVSAAAPAGWQKPVFDDASWAGVRVLGPASGTGPWKGLVWEAGGDDRFSVPPGFVVEPAVAKPDPKDAFSLVNLCFDGKGRLLVSQERGPVLLCTAADKDGVLRTVKPYCSQVTNCQGMCWLDGALYLVGKGPGGAGLYRCRDTDRDDAIDEVRTLHVFAGDMAEHGPHAVVPGPDGMLYLVVGNHAWAKPEKLAADSPLTRWPTGQAGPDQGQAGTTEDVLLPRIDDPRGHAAGVRAPGGTVWRCDREGRGFALVAAGFRNHYDAAFTPDGELFTFDSDMEWDEGLPWYRAVRVCHCPPGADFLWRGGAANTPGYYADSLPPAAETGRGSPVGVCCYDGTAFPAKYRGGLFLADWSIGTVWHAPLSRRGVSFAAKPERFCSGSALNVTDVATGPDGALYLALGGRGTQGGVFRVRYTGKAEPAAPARKRPPEDGPALAALARDPDPAVRADAVWRLGVRRPREAREALLAAVADGDAFVRRRACEAMVRAGVTPAAAQLKPLLADGDIYLRTAARLVLQRMPPAMWAKSVVGDTDDRVALEGVIALAKTDRLTPYTDLALRRLHAGLAQSTDMTLTLDLLRGVQLALVHGGGRPAWASAVGEWCFRHFPHADPRVSREMAVVLTHLRRDGQLAAPVHERLLDALARGDHAEQIHAFYCLRLLEDGWTPAQKARLLAWFDGTKSWQGGHSFAPFLEAMLRDLNEIFTPDDRREAVARAAERPWAAAALLRLASKEQLPPPDALLAVYRQLMKTSGGEMREGLVDALARHGPAGVPALRRVGDLDPAQRVGVARALARHPVAADDLPHLLRGLEAVPPPLYAYEMIDALMKSTVRPKADDALAVRGALLAANRMPPEKRWRAVELLRHWTGKRFGADDGDWKSELRSWATWYAQTYPKEPALPDAAADGPADAKYTFDELLALLTGPSAAKGDPARGRLAFTKAQCVKCHKYGGEGEAVGPELTTLAQRFRRQDTLEAVYYPSRVISDQYRASLIETSGGTTVTGIAAEQGDTVTVTLQDASKVTLKKADVAGRYASLVSVMPEKLLDGLTKAEVADLFAYLESAPPAGGK